MVIPPKKFAYELNVQQMYGLFWGEDEKERDGERGWTEREIAFRKCI